MPGKVVDCGGFAFFCFADFHNECIFVAAGECISQPFAAAADGASVAFFLRWYGIDIPGSAGVISFRDRDIDRFQFSFIPWVPGVEAEKAVIDAEEEFGVDAAVKAFHGNALEVFAVFIVDNDAVIGSVNYESAADCDLRVDLAIAIHGAVKDLDAVNNAAAAPLFTYRAFAFFSEIEAGLVNGFDEFGP